jgi:hypothetical protein
MIFTATHIGDDALSSGLQIKLLQYAVMSGKIRGNDAETGSFDVHLPAVCRCWIPPLSWIWIPLGRLTDRPKPAHHDNS